MATRIHGLPAARVRTLSSPTAPPALREAVARETARLSEQVSALDLYARSFERLYDPAFGWMGGASFAYPLDRRQDPTHAPLSYLTELEWFQHIALLRDLATRNHLFAGFLDHVARFVGPVTVQFVKAGSSPGGASAGPLDADGNNPEQTDPDVRAAQACYDEWCEVNEWGQGESDRELEGLVRALLEGESTLEWFKGGYGEVPKVRQIDPELIRKPDVIPEGYEGYEEEDWRWGILAPPNDAETQLALWVSAPEGKGGRVVKADRFTRTKCGPVTLPRSVKRGLSPFFPVATLLQKAAGLLENMAHVARLQAAIAWWEQFSSATQAQVLAMAAELRNPIPAGVPAGFQGSTQPPSNPFPPWQQETYPAGSIPRTDAGRTVLPGPVSTPGGFIEVDKVVMRSIGFMFGLPGTFTGDGGDSFASALVSGSPFVRLIEGRQKKAQGHTVQNVRRVLALCEESGRLPRGTSQRVRPVCTSAPVVIADEEKKARTRLALLAAGLDDPYDIMKDNGHDPKTLLANLAAFQAKRAQMGQVPGQQPPPGGGAPGQLPNPGPNPTPPGSAGGDGSSPNADPMGESRLAEGRSEGEVWQGQSGRYFTMKNGRPVLAKGPEGGTADKPDRYPDGTSRYENPHPKARAAYRAVQDYLKEHGHADPAELVEVMADTGLDRATADALVDALFERGLLEPKPGEGDALTLHKHHDKAAPALEAVKGYLADYGTASGDELVEHLKDQGMSKGAARRAIHDLHHAGALVKDGGQFKLPPPSPASESEGGGASGRGTFLSEAAPGPPPRPNLVWNDGTHRWRNPETGAEHRHAADVSKMSENDLRVLAIRLGVPERGVSVAKLRKAVAAHVEPPGAHPTVDPAQLERTITGAVEAHAAEHGSGARFDVLFAALKHEHPGLTPAEFKGALKKLAAEKRITLTGWNESTDDVPDPGLNLWHHGGDTPKDSDDFLYYHAVPASWHKPASESRLAEAFTGVDSHGHHWVNGKQVKAGDDEGAGHAKAAAEHHAKARAAMAGLGIPHEHLSDEELHAHLERLKPKEKPAAKPPTAAPSGDAGGDAGAVLVALYDRAGKPGLRTDEIDRVFASPEITKLSIPELKAIAAKLDVATGGLKKDQIIAKMRANVANRAGMHARAKM